MKLKKYALGGKLNIKGPRHERGGVPFRGAEVEGGETIQYIGKDRDPYVFSDRLRVPGSRDTFAQRHKQMKKGKEGTREILRLMKIQEKMNGPTQDKMFLGGLIRGVGRVAKKALPAAATIGLGVATGGASLGASSILGSALKYAPAAANVARGLFGKGASAVPDPRLTERRGIQALRAADTSINVNPQLNQIERQTRSIQADPSSSMAHRLLAQTNAMNATSGVLADRDNRQTAMRSENLGRVAGLQAGYDQADQRARMLTDDLRLRARGSKSNILGAGLSQISGIYQQDQANRTTLQTGIATATAHMDPEVRREFLRRLGIIGPNNTLPEEEVDSYTAPSGSPVNELGNLAAFGGFLKKKKRKLR